MQRLSSRQAYWRDAVPPSGTWSAPGPARSIWPNASAHIVGDLLALPGDLAEGQQFRAPLPEQLPPGHLTSTAQASAQRAVSGDSRPRLPGRHADVTAIIDPAPPQPCRIPARHMTGAVAGPRPAARTVPVLSRYHARLLAAARFAGKGLICGSAGAARPARPAAPAAGTGSRTAALLRDPFTRTAGAPTPHQPQPPPSTTSMNHEVAFSMRSATTVAKTMELARPQIRTCFPRGP